MKPEQVWMCNFCGITNRSPSKVSIFLRTVNGNTYGICGRCAGRVTAFMVAKAGEESRKESQRNIKKRRER